MTREEEIKEARHEWYLRTQDADFCAGFQKGAEWADKHPRWISVDKGLPTNSDNVLVCNSDGYMRVSYYHKVLGKWSNCDTYFTPTHWMHLPQPPKKGGEE